MNTLRDATCLLKRIVDENPKMPAIDVWNLFAGQAREEMVDAITEKSIPMIIEVMKGMRLQTRNAPRRQPRSVKPLLLATACVFIAALGWILYRDHLSGHIAAAEASSAAVYGDDRAGITFEQRLELERTLRRDLEQQLAARLVEQEALQNARRKDVEQQLAARQADQELLAKERARSNDLEQRLAARQTSEQALVLALARGRAHNQALEQELARRANATPGKERDANVRLSAPASDNPTPPAPIEQTAMPAR